MQALLDWHFWFTLRRLVMQCSNSMSHGNVAQCTGGVPVQILVLHPAPRSVHALLVLQLLVCHDCIVPHGLWHSLQEIADTVRREVAIPLTLREPLPMVPHSHIKLDDFWHVTFSHSRMQGKKGLSGAQAAYVCHDGNVPHGPKPARIADEVMRKLQQREETFWPAKNAQNPCL